MHPQPLEKREYKGHTVSINHINWHDHLDQAFQCNWDISKTKWEITYGSTQDEAFEEMKKIIDRSPLHP